MCVNYAPAQAGLLRDVFGVTCLAQAWPPETWPDYAAPLIVTSRDGRRECLLGTFGMVPRKRIPPGAARFDTTNARSESVGEKRAFSAAWKKGQLCLVPATCFYEPDYATGKAVRWRVWLKHDEPMAIAGLWRDWPGDGGQDVFSFTMLTINSGHHPLMSRFHAPGKEKRMIVIIPPTEWDDWLTCRDMELARSFLRPYAADRMAAEPAPLPPRAAAQT
ncbi:SOS response-associated peptidase family protein [Cupriavidus basilensis]|uniref:Abasic site processing protein n=1 Tax=Cupriavidus basilensis TaxID=68895 RepID=A0ABT6AU80_9BURK|nr:SOS response-associated peptidase family protein [Cupriavidus basilensis]MDF3836176.1 SOS response-associated peptidase family protein [Cupriavidus basilensis]